MNLRSVRFPCFRGSWGLVPAVLLALTGCGDAKTVPVSGQVVWTDGAPAGELAGFSVQATLKGGKVSARGEIDNEGRFKLGTFATGDGAEPGMLEVGIFPPPAVDGDPPPKVRLPARFRDPATSGLTINAERGKTNVVKLTVAKK